MVQVTELVADYTSLPPSQRSERIQALHRFIVAYSPQARLSFKHEIPNYELTDGWSAVASQKNYVSPKTCAREHIQPYIDIHPKINRGTGCLNFRDSDDIALGGAGVGTVFRVQ